MIWLAFSRNGDKTFIDAALNCHGTTARETKTEHGLGNEAGVGQRYNGL